MTQSTNDEEFVRNTISPTTYGKTLQSHGTRTSVDSTIDSYGSPLAEPLASQGGNGISNQGSADSSYGAPLAEPLDDGYGSPKANPIGSSYGAPLAQPVSLSYGAPLAAPLSRYQSKTNLPWPPPPPLPPSSNRKPPFSLFSFGRARRLSRYRHNNRNRHKRLFPLFNFPG